MQYNNFQLLHDVMDAQAKKLSIQLDVKDLKEERIEGLKDLIRMHPGTHHLSFVIYDSEDQVKLTMPSRKQKVKISQELLEELEKDEVYYKLN